MQDETSNVLQFRIWLNSSLTWSHWAWQLRDLVILPTSQVVLQLDHSLHIVNEGGWPKNNYDYRKIDFLSWTYNSFHNKFLFLSNCSTPRRRNIHHRFFVVFSVHRHRSCCNQTKHSTWKILKDLTTNAINEKRYQIMNLQSPSLQIPVSIKAVKSTSSQYSTQVRCRVFCPSLQVLLQSDHAVHKENFGRP